MIKGLKDKPYMERLGAMNTYPAEGTIKLMGSGGRGMLVVLKYLKGCQKREKEKTNLPSAKSRK